MEAGFSSNAATPAPAGSQDLIGTVSAISSSLMTVSYTHLTLPTNREV